MHMIAVRGTCESFVRALVCVVLTCLLQAAIPLSAGVHASPGITTIPERTPGVSDAPVPVTFPRDDGPHDVALEWWYYTGHLWTEDGQRYGFEQVFFKAQRESGGGVGLVSHVAVTDNERGVFQYAQRISLLPGLQTPKAGFDLAIGNWSMRGANGEDRLVASTEAYNLVLALRATKPPALHDGDGYIDYGGGQASYYYSRTRIAVTGTLAVNGEAERVTGEAWMDHQWGDFTTFRDGGWDWYSVQLDDGTDVMLYVIRAPDGRPLIVDGSVVDPAGRLTVLDREDFRAVQNATWTSPTTGITYPSGWMVEVPVAGLSLTLAPSMVDQELDTRQTTQVIYWEGEVVVQGSRNGQPVGGFGYVELTGYDLPDDLMA